MSLLVISCGGYHKDPDVVEFINNPDGTTSVIIKNIEKIKNLF